MIKLIAEPAGTNCPYGGTLVEAGLDSDPANGVLDAAEVTQTQYVCNGAPWIGCTIDSTLYASGASNPTNACQSCQPAVSLSAWEPVADGMACDDGNACTPTDTCLGGICVGSGSACTPVLSGYETRITADPGDQYDPSIDANIVVFTDYRGADPDVYYVNLNSMQEYAVVVAPGVQEFTDVSNGVIVYTDYRSADVMSFTTATGVTVNVTGPDKVALGRPFNSVDPAISLGLVAWEDDRDGNDEMYAKNTGTGEERRISDSPDVDQKAAVNGNLIVWQRCPASGGNCDVFLYDWSTGLTTQITNTPDGDERLPSIEGRNVVYQGVRNGEQDVFIYNLDTGVEKQLSLPGAQFNPHISGDYVSFDDLATAVYHVKLWNYTTGDVFQIPAGTSAQYLNKINGNRVVYTDDRDTDLDIYMYTFTVVEQPNP